jgi:uncharacterized protein YkwD
MIRCHRALCLLFCLLSSILLHAQEPSETHKAEPDQRQKLRQLVTDMENRRTTAEGRVKIVEKMLVLGPAGEAALKDHLDRTLRNLRQMITPPPATPALDDQIEKLRATLADLRHDESLTKEALETTGLSALDQLTAAYTQRETARKSHYQRMGRLAAQLDQFGDFLRQWEAKAGDESALQPPTLSIPSYREKTAELLAQVSPNDEKARRVLQENEKIGQQLPPEVMAGLRALNAMRIMCGLQPLLIDLKLCEAAKLHSADMEKLRFFSHVSPVAGKSAPFDRARLAGTTACGENIYKGSDITVEALRGWFLNPGHHRNMLGELPTRQGLGHSGKYWTQMFGS